jgi:adenylate kinase family enzyme
MRVLSLLGRPGTDTGLFARLLAARLRAPEALSVRVAAAAEVRHRTHLGVQIERWSDEHVGANLPSALVAPLVQSRLQMAAASGGELVLAGFPRSADQLRMMQHAGLSTPTVLHLSLPRDQSVLRVADRRVCDACGEPMYPLNAVKGAPAGLHTHLVESDCETPIPRQDSADLSSPLALRLDDFDTHTAPLLEQLRGRGAVLDIPLGETAQATWNGVLVACGLPPDEEPDVEPA